MRHSPSFTNIIVLIRGDYGTLLPMIILQYDAATDDGHDLELLRTSRRFEARSAAACCVQYSSAADG